MKCVEVEVDSERLHVEMVNYTLAVMMGVILKRLIEWCSEETRRDASILEDRLNVSSSSSFLKQQHLISVIHN